MLVIASDGVWDVLDDATAMALCNTFASRQVCVCESE
jgi:serine/threonine protein phosphatase PrpC